MCAAGKKYIKVASERVTRRETDRRRKDGNESDRFFHGNEGRLIQSRGP